MLGLPAAATQARLTAIAGNARGDLDVSGGHTSTTQYSSTPVYHYHIKNQIYSTINGKADYLLFDGVYQGTPNTISN